jgi:bacterioferritin-associated ferredoxin
VHLTGGVRGTVRRISTAKQVVPTFGVATECGMGRRAPDTILRLLEIHAEVAGEVR